MPYLLGSELGFPKNYYNQEALLEALIELWGDSLFMTLSRKSFTARNLLIIAAMALYRI